MNSPIRIVAAGNVEVPAYLALKARGYLVERTLEVDDAARECWSACKDGQEFIGDGPLQLLGLVGLFEARGENWVAGDEELEQFLVEFS